MTLHHCYACFFNAGVMVESERQAWRSRDRAWAYERLVEHIESLQGQGPFSISRAWRADPMKSPSTFNMIQKVVHDMALHGLIVCVKPDRAGKCRGWDFAT